MKNHRFKAEFHPKDILQVVLGAAILAIPVGFTEETWELGGMLPWANIIGFVVLSLFFIAAFTYYHYYRGRVRKHSTDFAERVFLTYIVSLFVVAALLTLIQVTPWVSDFGLSIKRTIIVTFPASLSGAVADVIR